MENTTEVLAWDLTGNSHTERVIAQFTKGVDLDHTYRISIKFDKVIMEYKCTRALRLRSISLPLLVTPAWCNRKSTCPALHMRCSACGAGWKPACADVTISAREHASTFALFLSTNAIFFRERAQALNTPLY